MGIVSEVAKEKGCKRERRRPRWSGVTIWILGPSLEGTSQTYKGSEFDKSKIKEHLGEMLVNFGRRSQQKNPVAFNDV